MGIESSGINIAIPKEERKVPIYTYIIFLPLKKLVLQTVEKHSILIFTVIG